MPAVAHDKPLIHDEITFARRFLNLQRRALLVGGKPADLKIFRVYHFDVYAVFPELNGHSGKHILIGKLAELPFAQEAFQQIYWQHKNPEKLNNQLDWLNQARQLLEPEGFLFFDVKQYPVWHHRLMNSNWERLPFLFGSNSVWRKPKKNGKCLCESA